MSLDPIVKAIKNRRKLIGWTKAQIAEIAGMSQRTYERIECGESDMHLSQYRAILRALKISELDILLDTLKIREVSGTDILAASRLLSPESRKLLAHFLVSLKEQEI